MARAVAGATIGLAFAAAAFVLTFAFIPSQRAGLGFRTANSRGLVLAAAISPASNRAQIAAQIADAQSIVARDATNQNAVRSLAVLLDQSGQRQPSLRLLQLAERLSRRDALTEIALIEVAVGRGSVSEALRHYDRALTTNARTADTLIPILAAATADPAIAGATAAIAARRPLWWPQLLDGMIATGPAAATGQVAWALALRPDQPLEGWRLSAVIDKLATAGNADAALRLARRARPGLDGRLAGGDFERIGDLPPFDWQLFNTDALAAVREQRDGADGNFALSLVAASGASGVVARRLLLLPAGPYRLRLRAGDLADDAAARPRLVLRCAAKGGATLADRAIDATAVAATVTVPRGCIGQWLELRLTGSPFDRSKTPWVDDIAVEPAS